MTEWEKHTMVLVTNARRAIERDELGVPPEHPGLADLMRAPLTPLGLVDISKLSQEAISLGRVVGMGVGARDQMFAEPRAAAPASPSPELVQCELFGLFAQLFAALTGVAVEHIRDFEEVKGRLLDRAHHEFQSFSSSFNSAADELTAFYNAHGTELFQYAKSLGGMKAVAGCQRQFTESSLNATRISGLYLDTQLEGVQNFV